MTINKLEIPCSYQGGKQRLVNQIVDILYQENRIDENTLFYDLCCGSGAISLEMINSGFRPENIVMVDNECFGSFWESIASNTFDLSDFRDEIDKIPNDVSLIQSYIKNLSGEKVNQKKMIYHYLILQAASFGSKQIWIEDNIWKNTSFRNYWLQNGTSNRKSPVNPMMPMPDTLFFRVEKIVNNIGGKVNARKCSVFDMLNEINRIGSNIIVYIDPPYQGATKYKNTFNIYDFVSKINNSIPIYISEGVELNGANRTYLLSGGRKKGNISGNSKKQPIKEYLNKYGKN